MASIDTDAFSADLRSRAIRVESGEILISRIAGSDQEFDLTDPPNADGFGRVRHFRGAQPYPWPHNPLPVEPAAHRLGVSSDATATAEVFQNAACNWRCWYCYVPFSLLSANPEKSGWFTARQLVDLYVELEERPLVIDCSGGQPDIVPEWIPWMMDALTEAGLAEQTYLWSDDNLSNDYFWEHLSSAQIDRVASYRNYGRVACFKGFDEQSFAFNTKAEESLFAGQFDLFSRLLETGMDLYGYATFTGPESDAVAGGVVNFVDRLQEVDRNLPLRLIPLRIAVFGVVGHRVREPHKLSLEVQDEAIAVWNAELDARFSTEERALSIAMVPWAEK